MQDNKRPMTKSWSSIREFYESLEVNGRRFESMIDLVRMIEASPYSTGLFAWTSMHTLRVVQTVTFYPYDGPELQINPKCSGELEFSYHSNAWRKRDWYRVAPEGQGFDRLLKFMDQLRWIPRINFPTP